MTRADEKPPEDHWKKRFPEIEKTQLLMLITNSKVGTMDGVPTKETGRMDLGYVAEDLEKRGILKDGQD